MNKRAREIEHQKLAASAAAAASKHSRITSYMPAEEVNKADEADEADETDEADEADKANEKEEENSENQALRHFWNEKEQFKEKVKQKKLIKTHHQMGEDITTSDIKIEIKNAHETLKSDYSMQLHLKLYMNKTLLLQKILDKLNRH